jgi:hypothetical protein
MYVISDVLLIGTTLMTSSRNAEKRFMALLISVHKLFPDAELSTRKQSTDTVIL